MLLRKVVRHGLTRLGLAGPARVQCRLRRCACRACDVNVSAQKKQTYSHFLLFSKIIHSGLYILNTFDLCPHHVAKMFTHTRAQILHQE